MNEDLNKWFKEKWVNIGKKVDGKHPPCGTSGEKKGYAKCVPAAKAAGMSKKEKESATQRKRAAQHDAGRGGKSSSGQGKTPIYVSTKPKNEEWSDKYKSSIDCNNPKGFSQKAHCQGKKKNENMNIEERLNLFLEKNCPTDPGKWSASKAAAKSKFDVYPSAYANGWAAKNYKGKGGGWKTCSENVVNEDNTAFETLMLIRNLEQTNKLLAQDLKTSKRLPNDKKENIKKSIVVNQGLINYYKETYKNLKNNESVNEAAPCWKGYKQVGMKDKGGRQVPNCVPNESVNEAPNTGEKIQNLNNRIKALKDKMAATKSSEQKNLIQQRLKNALQTLSNYKKQNISKESVVKEATYNFGKEEYTKKNLTPTQIQDLAFGYVQTPITKLVGKTLGHRVNLANDLARLTGTKQLDAKARGKEAALIMVLLKNKLISKEEYIQMYKDLIEKHQQVIKYLKNASPEMRNSGGAARAAAKDMKGEFDMD